MTFTVKVDPEAEREWREAVHWYGEHDLKLGRRLNLAIRGVLRKVARNPDRFARISSLTHKVKVPRPWPYSIYFAIDAGRTEVRVLAVWHGARDPEELRRRLK